MVQQIATDTLENDNDDALDETVSYSAQDSVVSIQDSGRVYLYGKAKVIYGRMNLEADVIEVDYRHNTVIAYGRRDSLDQLKGTPVFREGGSEPMEAEKIIYNLKTRKGKIYNALTKQGDLLVIGKEIKKDSNDVVYMKDMRCIPCQEPDARTMFRATKAKIIPNDKIVTGPMYVQIGGVPTPLGLPFGYFPNTKSRHNGVILPTYGRSQAQGYYLRGLGLYFGFNEMTDMVVKGDIYGNGSFAFGAVNSYNIRYKFSGYTDIGYTQNNFGDKDIPSQYSRQKSYRVRWLHTQDNKADPSVRFSADVNYVSNQNINKYFTQNTGQYLQNSFQSNVVFSKTFRYSVLSINASQAQASQTRLMTIVMPSLTYNVNRFFPFRRSSAVKQNVFDKIGVSYLLQFQNSLTGRDTSILKGNFLDSLQYGARQSIPISTNFDLFKGITVTPSMNFNTYHYMRGISKKYDPETKTLQTNTNKAFYNAYDANFSTLLNTKVYFDYVFGKGKLSQIRHVMIPSLTYNYHPDFGQPQYGVWKQVQVDSLGNKRYYSVFERGNVGGPGIGKQNSLSIYINNNVDAKVRQKTDSGTTYKKQVILQGLSAGATYNFAADSMKMSMVTLNARTNLFKYFDVVAGAVYDPYVYNHEQKRDMNQYLYDQGGLLRFYSARVTVNTSIGSNMVAALRKTRSAPDLTTASERGSTKQVDESGPMPWNLTLLYGLDLTNYDATRTLPSHYVNFSGGISPTKFWRFEITSGYSFSTQQVTYTKVTIVRDLKCWQANISWIPIGPNKSYNVGVSLKSAMFRDIVIPKQRLFVDNFSQ